MKCNSQPSESPQDRRSLADGGERVMERLDDLVVTLRHLADLASGQRELIEHEDPQPLLGLLADRQRHIDRLIGDWSPFTSLGEAMRSLRRRTGGSTEGALPVESRAMSLVDEIESLLARVIETDAVDQSRLQARLREIGEELATNRTARVAATAYTDRSGSRAGAGARPRFADREG